MKLSAEFGGVKIAIENDVNLDTKHLEAFGHLMTGLCTTLHSVFNVIGRYTGSEKIQVINIFAKVLIGAFAELNLVLAEIDSSLIENSSKYN